ncbi:O-methyltransferase [Euzebya tangerina]|uniref:O-methyltransferase n=1 Tax=Euzebya tangerina TaxID=591198 RepID=UPI00196AF4E8|nr:class I SAM-dependent methyltransferase [Euzebya tangerina]
MSASPEAAGPGAPRLRPVTPIGIAAALLEAVEDRLVAHGDVDQDILDDLRGATARVAGLEPYVARCTTPASAALEQLEADTNRHDWSAVDADGATPGVEREMLSGHVEGQLLRMLVGVAAARSVLDIGLFSGYSSLAMAEGLPDDGRVIGCEVDPRVADFARDRLERSPHGHKVEIRVGPATETLAALTAEQQVFDVAFLDADKGGYQGYLTRLLDDRLVRPGGLILADNTLLQGQPYATGSPSGSGAAIATFNEAVLAEQRVEQVLIPLRDGVTLMRVLGDD